MQKTEVKQLMKQGKIDAQRAVKLILQSLIHEQKTGKPLFSPEEKKEIKENKHVNAREFNRLGSVVQDIFAHYMMCTTIALEWSHTYQILLHLLMDYLQHLKMLVFSQHLYGTMDKKNSDLLLAHYVTLWKWSINLVGAELESPTSLEDLRGVSIMDCKVEIIGLIKKCLSLRDDYLDIFGTLKEESDDVGSMFFFDMCVEKNKEMIEQREHLMMILNYLHDYFTQEDSSYDLYLNDYISSS